MIEMIAMGGPYAMLLTVLSIVISVLSVKKAVDLYARTGLEPERLESGLNAILFWGGFSAILGFLGQFSGIYLSLKIIRKAGLIHPGMVAEGLAVALITALYGLGILAVSGMIWFGLRCRLHRLTRSQPDPGGPAGSAIDRR